MSEVFTNRDEQGRRKGAPGEIKSREPPRIRIDVPMGTPYQEIQEFIFRQVYELAGTQLRAAIALGITPDTVSRVMRRSVRRIAGTKVPEPWPVVNQGIRSSDHRATDGEAQSPDQENSMDQVNIAENQSSTALSSSSEDVEEEMTTLGDERELNLDD